MVKGVGLFKPMKLHRCDPGKYIWSLNCPTNKHFTVAFQVNVKIYKQD